MKQVNFDCQFEENLAYNVTPKNISVKIGGRSLFIYESNKNYGYKLISSKKISIKQIWFSEINPNEVLLDNEQRLLYANFSNFLAEYHIAPEVYGFETLKINNFEVVGIKTERLREKRLELNPTSNEAQYLIKTLKSLDDTYNLYSTKNILNLFDFGALNFGYDKNSRLKTLDLEWSAFFENLTFKTKNYFTETKHTNFIERKDTYGH